MIHECGSCKQNALALQRITVPGFFSLAVYVTASTMFAESAGYVPPGNKYKDLPTIRLQIVSSLVSVQLLCDDSLTCMVHIIQWDFVHGPNLLSNIIH